MIGVHCATAFALLATSSIHVAAAETGNYYYEHWCGMDGGLRLLDDTECAKRFPSPSRSFRDWTCSHRVIDEGDDDDAHLWKPQQDLKDVFVEPLTPMEDIGMAVVSIRRDVVTNEPLFRYFGTPNFGERMFVLCMRFLGGGEGGGGGGGRLVKVCSCGVELLPPIWPSST